MQNDNLTSRMQKFNRSQGYKKSYSCSGSFYIVKASLWVFACLCLPGLVDVLGYVFLWLLAVILGDCEKQAMFLENISLESFCGVYKAIWDAAIRLFVH